QTLGFCSAVVPAANTDQVSLQIATFPILVTRGVRSLNRQQRAPHSATPFAQVCVSLSELRNTRPRAELHRSQEPQHASGDESDELAACRVQPRGSQEREGEPQRDRLQRQPGKARCPLNAP